MPLLLADFFVDTQTRPGEAMLRAMPIMLGVLCILAIAYRYYSAFLAAKVMAFDDKRITPAHTLNDGQNYQPTNRWVLFGHHFAAISGAGPLIGPVLAMQYGYAPGLLWLVIGVCLAGAVQDMLVMGASVRRGGKSLAEIARLEMGNSASLIASLAILFIVIIALAGLAFVIVKALGGEEAKLPAGTQIQIPDDTGSITIDEKKNTVLFPKGCEVRYAHNTDSSLRSETFKVVLPAGSSIDHCTGSYYAASFVASPAAAFPLKYRADSTIILPAGCKQVIAGSSWGTFTIACTIPIALLVGLWIYRVRKGRILEASLIGGAAVLGAVALGAYIPGSSLEWFFSLSREQTILALCIYGFIAAVLPVWLLLTPRDYLSSFMKIGTLILLVLAIIVANPTLKHPPINETFQDGGPTFDGGLFPFVFICVMCGAISGFHALVASGTTPKMIDKESDIRVIGYGAMLTEGLVGVVALIAAAAMPPHIYYPINVDVERFASDEKLRAKLAEVNERYGTLSEARDPMHKAGVRDIHQLNLGQIEESVGGESLRGRTGGAVTLAVSMSLILTDAFSWLDQEMHHLIKYWYHFAIMFEALFILTTIDAGTRIARYLFQETLGRVHPNFARSDWLPGAVFASFLVTAGWGFLVYSGQINTIWPMFGIANQLLAVMALALVTTMLVNSGRARYALVTLLPMLFVTSTTLTAGKIQISNYLRRIDAGVNVTVNTLNMSLTIFVIVAVCAFVAIAASRWISKLMVPGSRSN